MYVSELRLPGDAVITLILRDAEIFVPDVGTVLRAHDHLLLATSNKGRTATERRLRAISRAGRLAGWYGELGDPMFEGRSPRPELSPAQRVTGVVAPMSMREGTPSRVHAERLERGEQHQVDAAM